ncbi:hypothetical protein N7539_009435 [Penicillium diatomitis]|uniref:Uncharacterized protein n=1 Tax=Penicillium diatomitis TaxID=2819901 RepID=A0A9X0BJE7_9EURO|nr:uncharacterized protein N7539_009435 [Penicillium diatomitis]KAJ5466706.1 hypothetical protein N7539_009435 [Penicillium diatomitis]
MASFLIGDCLAGAALLSSFIITILNGLTYSQLQSLDSHTSTAGLAALLLSILTCVILLTLGLLLQRVTRCEAHYSNTWKITIITLAGLYLSISSICMAGMITSDNLLYSPRDTHIFIARSICWTISVLAQGMYFSSMLIALVQRKSFLEQEWPRSELQELKTLPETPWSAGACSPSPTLCDESYAEFPRFDTRRSSLRKYPRQSSRLSGGTVCTEENGLPSKYEPFDIGSSAVPSRATSPTMEHTPAHTSPLSPAAAAAAPSSASTSNSFVDSNARPPSSILPARNSSLRSSSSLRRKINIKAPPNIHLSLDALVHQSSSTSSTVTSPNTTLPGSESTPNLPETYAFYCGRKSLQGTSCVSLPCSPMPSPTFPATHNNLSPTSRPRHREYNIHPLFRSTSPGPSPTPLPGSIVKASPSAGRTITQKTLMRMRSARELRASRRDEEWHQSADSVSLPDPGTWMAMGRAGYVRNSVTRYEKKGDLAELTEENRI